MKDTLKINKLSKLDMIKLLGGEKVQCCCCCSCSCGCVGLANTMATTQTGNHNAAPTADNNSSSDKGANDPPPAGR